VHLLLIGPGQQGCRWLSTVVGVSGHRPAATTQPYDARVDGGVSMSSLFDSDKEAVRHESAISSLRNRTGAPQAEVRSLFSQEFSRLELGAKVRSYLSILTASNVRTMLRRKGA